MTGITCCDEPFDENGALEIKSSRRQRCFFRNEAAEARGAQYLHSSNNNVPCTMGPNDSDAAKLTVTGGGGIY